MTSFLLSLAHMQQVHHKVKNEEKIQQEEHSTDTSLPSAPPYQAHLSPRISPFNSTDMNTESVRTPTTPSTTVRRPEQSSTTSEKHTLHSFYGSHSSLRQSQPPLSPVRIPTIASNHSIHDPSQSAKESNELMNEFVLVSTIPV
jgi:hypothetical protein